ncbi:hypothetical protein C8A05DRAFT_20495, partial [Staphylotrichum tortipilum]
FNSPSYLSNPTIYDGLTQKFSHTNRKTEPFVHYFDTARRLQHNDIGPQWHLIDVGAVKVASHLLQFVRMTFGWELEARGP